MQIGRLEPNLTDRLATGNSLWNIQLLHCRMAACLCCSPAQQRSEWWWLWWRLG